MTNLGVVSFAGEDDAFKRRTPFARRADTLASLVDEIVESEVKLGIAQANRARAIERARTYSEASAQTSTSTPASRDMARRSFVAEVAAALRIPDGSADRLIATSETLIRHLPSTCLLYTSPSPRDS